MRQLLPVPCDPVDPAVLYGDLPLAGTRPAVRLNMIASIDGATAVAGLSGGLGGPADQALFAVLRSHADVVLVAAARSTSCSPAMITSARLAAFARSGAGASATVITIGGAIAAVKKGESQSSRQEREITATGTFDGP